MCPVHAGGIQSASVALECSALQMVLTGFVDKTQSGPENWTRGAGRAVPSGQKVRFSACWVGVSFSRNPGVGEVGLMAALTIFHLPLSLSCVNVQRKHIFPEDGPRLTPGREAASRWLRRSGARAAACSPAQRCEPGGRAAFPCSSSFLPPKRGEGPPSVVKNVASKQNIWPELTVERERLQALPACQTPPPRAARTPGDSQRSPESRAHQDPTANPACATSPAGQVAHRPPLFWSLVHRGPDAGSVADTPVTLGW